jgi:dihydroorotate dehydrogenase (NAD+) catalytic subunit
VPIVGCGGVSSGEDVVEYLLAGASAVALGSVHFAEPRAGARILRELVRWMENSGINAPGELVGAAEPW